MIATKARTLQAALAATAGLGVFMANDVSPTTFGLFMPQAHAIIGRPATPMSYAGVARRTTRGVYGAPAYGAAAGVAVGAAVARPAYVAPGGCVQTVDAYGRLVTQCY